MDICDFVKTLPEEVVKDVVKNGTLTNDIILSAQRHGIDSAGTFAFAETVINACLRKLAFRFIENTEVKTLWRLVCVYINQNGERSSHEHIITGKTLEDALIKVPNIPGRWIVGVTQAVRLGVGKEQDQVADLEEEFVLVPKNTQEYVMSPMPNNSCWVQVGNIDVSLKKTDEGVIVEAFAMGNEGQGDPMFTTYLFFNEAIEGDDEVEN